MSPFSFFVRSAMALGLLAATPTAKAEERAPCAPRERVVERLAERYGETLRSMGLDQGNGLVEIYTSDTGTWTMLLSLPDGRSCLLASGQLWEADAAPLKKPGKDA